MALLDGKTVFMSGGSRGIGLAIAKRFAGEGANIILAAKTTEPQPNLEGTIHSAAAEIEEAGGGALPVQCDIRFEDQVEAAVRAGVDEFGGLDVCINNASAISMTRTLDTPMKRYDLMHNINVRGTFLVSQKCIPHLRNAENPHVLTLSPPLDMRPEWFAPFVAYAMAKYGMSMVMLGMAEEFKGEGIAFNCLWPRTMISTAAVRNVIGGDEAMNHCRFPEIVADSAMEIVSRPAASCTGNFFLDDELLASAGIDDFSKYADAPDEELNADFFVDPRYARPYDYSVS